MKKITKKSDLNRIFDKVAEDLALSANVRDFKGVSLFSLDNIENFFVKILEASDFLEEVGSGDFFYILGPHASGKQVLANKLARSVLKKKDLFLYDYREQRDRLKKHGTFYPIDSFHICLKEIERALLAFGSRCISHSQTVIVSDCGLTPARRNDVLRKLSVNPIAKIGIAIVLIRPLDKLIVRNGREGSFIERTMSYSDYYTKLDFSIPVFSEGFKKVIYLNDTKPDDPNYISNDTIKKEYIKMYGQSQLVIKEFSE